MISTPRSNDPVSNLRPIIYTDTATLSAQGPLESHASHPYSLHEFTDVPRKTILSSCSAGLPENSSTRSITITGQTYVARVRWNLDPGSVTHGYTGATRGLKQPSKYYIKRSLPKRNYDGPRVGELCPVVPGRPNALTPRGHGTLGWWPQRPAGDGSMGTPRHLAFIKVCTFP